MKKLITIALCAFLAGAANAQTHVKQEVKKDAKAVGNKTAEVSSKVAAKIHDKTYADKQGPGGETIYIDKHSRYYYINDKGHKVYVKKSQLKNK